MGLGDFIKDLVIGRDPGYEWEGTYSKDELAKMFAQLPGGSMPSGAGIQKLLGQIMEWEQGYRHPLQKELIGEFNPIPAEYEKAAGANAAQLYGGQGQEFEKYSSAKGQEVQSDIKRDILAKADENKARASRKIGVAGKGMGLDVLGRQAAGIGGFPRESALANMMNQQLGFESQLEMQKFQNEMGALQHQYPAPQQVYNPGSPGLLSTLLPSLLMNALPGIGDGLGSLFNKPQYPAPKHRYGGF